MDEGNKDKITFWPRHKSTLTIDNSTISLCSFYDYKICIMNHDGKVIKTYGDRGSEAAGDLNEPYLCQEDDEGAMLIADYGNGRIQVLDKWRNWSIVKMQTAVNGPNGAVYVNGTLYVISLNDSKLYSYTAKIDWVN